MTLAGGLQITADQLDSLLSILGIFVKDGVRGSAAEVLR
jgi:hypothetical protein